MLLVQALAAARETLYQQARGQEPEGDPPAMAQQQADALAPASMPKSWRIPTSPVSRSSGVARAFQLEHPPRTSPCSVSGTPRGP